MNWMDDVWVPVLYFLQLCLYIIFEALSFTQRCYSGSEVYLSFERLHQSLTFSLSRPGAPTLPADILGVRSHASCRTWCTFQCFPHIASGSFIWTPSRSFHNLRDQPLFFRVGPFPPSEHASSWPGSFCKSHSQSSFFRL